MRITAINSQDNRNLKFGAGLKYAKHLKQIMNESGAEALPKTFDGMNNFIVTPNSKLKDLITKSTFFTKMRKSADMFVTEYKEETETSVMNYFNVYFKKNKNSERIETINFEFETNNEDAWYKELKGLIDLADENHEYIWGNKKIEGKSDDVTINDVEFMVKLFKSLPKDIVEKIWYQKKLTKAEQNIVDKTVNKIAKSYSKKELEKLNIVEGKEIKETAKRVKNKKIENNNESSIKSSYSSDPESCESTTSLLYSKPEHPEVSSPDYHECLTDCRNFANSLERPDPSSMDFDEQLADWKEYSRYRTKR